MRRTGTCSTTEAWRGGARSARIGGLSKQEREVRHAARGESRRRDRWRGRNRTRDRGGAGRERGRCRQPRHRRHEQCGDGRAGAGHGPPGDRRRLRRGRQGAGTARREQRPAAPGPHRHPREQRRHLRGHDAHGRHLRIADARLRGLDGHLRDGQLLLRARGRAGDAGGGRRRDPQRHHRAHQGRPPDDGRGGQRLRLRQVGAVAPGGDVGRRAGSAQHPRERPLHGATDTPMLRAVSAAAAEAGMRASDVGQAVINILSHGADGPTGRRSCSEPRVRRASRA